MVDFCLNTYTSMISLYRYSKYTVPLNKTILSFYIVMEFKYTSWLTQDLWDLAAIPCPGADLQRHSNINSQLLHSVACMSVTTPMFKAKMYVPDSLCVMRAPH